MGSAKAHGPLMSAMLDEARVEAGTRLLDVGCGGGHSSALAVKRGARVTGLDASEGMINYARRDVPEAGFRVGDIQELPFEDRSFDVVFAANSVQYAEDLLPALRELRRVCTKGGRIVAGPFDLDDRRYVKGVEDLIAALEKRWADYMQGEQLVVPHFTDVVVAHKA